MRNFDHPTRYGRISPQNAAWLSQRPRDPALEPNLPIVDPHHHLWNRAARVR
jgi:L-fuconolactonase